MKQDQGRQTSPDIEPHDLVEWYFEQGWTDGLPVVPPTPETVAAMVAASVAMPGGSTPVCRRGGAT